MINTLNNKRILVLGLGETGLSALRWLFAQGAKVAVADTRENPPNIDAVKVEFPEVNVYLGELDVNVLKAVDMLVVSPGVALSEPAIQAAIEAGVSVVGDVELFAQYRPASSKVIAITGANGKTTVTTLVGEMCKAAGLKTIVAGNIGLPVLDALGMEKPDVYVLELSSFQLETTNSLVADAATMLNLTEDHMDRYSELAVYAAAKAHIFYQAKHQVLNRDDAWSMIMERPSLAVTTFGLDFDVNAFGIQEVENEIWLCNGEQQLINAADLRIKGAHNAANALAAIALCRAIGLEYAPLLNALYNFKGLPHRVQWVANIDDVDYYDDSKGTNVGATCAALSGLPQKVVLIAGGDGKGQDFTPLQSPVSQNARAVVLIGRDAALIEQVLLATEVPMYHAQDMYEAVVIARRIAQVGDAVLLSPACASFDMYKNYVSRAEAFVSAVKQQEVATC
ncbi:MAG: UDP-N-acetylmuramoyl-L-alanine--D-glutamate ligase [Betaproteobacteria bacterium]|nr:UDP-N-acetylmuramoyl-L-alanine--D-glutamate ligase [Betaproteobacteria bacterium]MCH9849846.1 UDP-N-acetylmuramoyl-L-alanine--D-glutamate ligase [Betaproteobacteria bacterium]